MNPFPMVLADLRALRWTAPAIVLLVALAIATGVAIGAQERALRLGSARAADDFDLLIGAPGSQTQLLMSATYLQAEALPLVEGRLLQALAQDQRVADFAPIAFGDISRGYPIVGTTAGFAGRWGRIAPTQGRLFEDEGEAVVGADVNYRLGETITPSHGHAGDHHPGEENEDEAGHRHEGHGFKVVGRLPKLGSPWDRAILVPVESVWEIHGLGNGHASAEPGSDSPFWRAGSGRGEGRPAREAGIGAPFDGKRVPGVPAIVVKPKSVAGAYALRAQYRQGGTMAFFPAEILVSLYGALGDMRDILVVASATNTVLILASVILLLIAVNGLRRRRYATLRALGAPRSYVLLVTWLGMAALIAVGCVAGLVLGVAATRAVSGIVAARTGLELSPGIGPGEFAQAALLCLIGSILALCPAIISYRSPVMTGLRS
ncbi:FtsX-like permease family protein [Bosea sp. 124]|uniref:FtsX-like permease family protein n=1 Tax=Bosea sp. 124 TaxID=2135642 RepID=UPI000D3B52D8|nr:FtsX-like permease family protein [Bosea sp. 124]PTM40798.1 putative ABC transport system permease protein [Bosea sp. 124]